MSEMNDPACSSARLGRISRINQTVPSPKFIIIAENTVVSLRAPRLLQALAY